MLAEVAPLAPLIGESAWTVVGIGSLAFFVVMLGLKKGYHYSLGGLFFWLAKTLHGVPLVGHRLASAVEAVDTQIESLLASGLLASETVLGKWWYYQKEIATYTYDSLAWLAHSTLAAFDSLVTGTIPHAVTSVVAPVKTDLGRLRAALRAEARTLERDLVRQGHAIEAELTHDFGLAKRGIDYVRGTAVPRVAGLVHTLEGEVADVRAYTRRVLARRLSRLEKALAAGALGAVAIAALTRVFPYWQCRNVKRLLRGVCRAPTAWLDLLFGVGLEAFVVADLCDFIAAVSGAASAVEPALLAFVEVEDVLIGCHGATKPPPLPIPALDAPPPTAALALAL